MRVSEKSSLGNGLIRPIEACLEFVVQSCFSGYFGMLQDPSHGFIQAYWGAPALC